MVKKKTKMDKELARLRRENEALKAQLKTSGYKDFTRKNRDEEISDSKLREREEISVYTNRENLREDLTKTVFVTSLAIFLLSLLYYTEDWWSKFVGGLF